MILSSTKKFRRIATSVTLATTIVASMFAGTAFAGPQPTTIQLSVLQPDEAPIYKGTTTEFMVDAANIAAVDENGLSQMIFQVEYDPAVFDEEGYTTDDQFYQPSGVKLNPAVPEGMQLMDTLISHDNGKTQLTFTLVNTADETITPVMRAFLSFKLHVKDDAPVGDTGIIVRPYDETSIVDSTGEAVPSGLITSPVSNFTIQALPTLTSVTARADSQSLIYGGTTNVHLQGTYSDSAIADLTGSATWTSSNPAVATVSSTGTVLAGSVMGSTTITGTYNGLISFVQISVVPIITPPPSTFLGFVSNQDSLQIDNVGGLGVLLMQEMWTTGVVDVTTTGTWTSSNASVALVFNGAVNAMGLGDAVITYTNAHGSKYVPVHVGPVVQPEPVLESVYFTEDANDPLRVDKQVSPQIKGHFSDNHEELIDPSAFTFTIDDESVATIGADGLLTGVKDGITKITAQYKADESIEPIWNYVWVVNDDVHPPAFDHIGIEPYDVPTIEVGNTLKLKAKAYFDEGSISYDLSRYATWTSTNDTVLSVDKHGELTAIAVGAAIISATVPNYGRGSQHFTVEAAATPEPQVVSVHANTDDLGTTIDDSEGYQFTLTATYDDESTNDVTSQATWTSDDEDVVTISEGGKMTPVGLGTTHVHGTFKGFTADILVTVNPLPPVSISVSPSSGNILVGETLQLQVIGTFADSTTADVTDRVSIDSSDLSIVGVSSTGLLTGLSAGTAEITIAKGGQLEKKLSITVRNSSSGGGTVISTPPVQVEKPIDLKVDFDKTKLEEMIKKASDTPSKTFTDVTPATWSSEAIQKATSMGIIDGYEDNSFRPDASITRAEFATIVAKAFNLVSSSSTTFPDAMNHWGSKAIEALVGQGVLTGYGDGTFKPDKEITRAEIVTVLSRLTDFKPVEKSTFTDIDNNWASTQIKVFAEQGIVKGISTTEFAPNDSASRAEAVSMLIRLIDLIVKA
ncbi:Ig-like domain-containing protein [Paenibacillus glycanilyticus]|uniref:Ig-like domain-containing protein n=1 Tax=Paenibacillus glycanilyticus TaxID=126569 RepID=UPI000FDC57ED|nr:Ig-like domain-containing protein [Paenibacillus glycanilyticus]